MSKVLDLRTERVKVEDILIANQRLKEVCRHTPWSTIPFCPTNTAVKSI